MQKIIFIFTGLILFSIMPASGQCPEKDFLYRRINFIGDSAGNHTDKQLNELLKYESAMKDCSYRNDSTHDELILIIGRIYWERGDFLKAIEYLKESINLKTSNPANPSLNQKRLITNYYYLSDMYDSLHNVAEEIKSANNAIDVAHRLHATNELGCIRALYTRIVYLFDIGDFNRCAEDAIMCEKLAREYTLLNSHQPYLLYTGKSLASGSIAWYIEAVLSMKKYDLAEISLSSKEVEFREARLDKYLGGIYEGLARVQLNKNNFKLAMEYLNKALASEKKVGNFFNYKQLLITIGHEVYFTRYPDMDKAFEYYQKALAYSGSDKSRTEQDAMESLKVYNYIANVYVKKQMYKEAFANFQLAFDEVKKGSNETSIANTSRLEIIKMKKLHYLADLIIDKGDALMSSYGTTKNILDVKAAIGVYNMADRFLNKIKEEQSDVLSKLFWRSGTRRLYEHAIEACFLSGDASEAFNFFEKSRSILLYDQLNKQYMMSNNDIAVQEQLKRNLLTLERKMDNQTSGSKDDEELTARHFFIHRQLDSVEALIKVNNPFYYQRVLDTSALNVGGVVAKLLKDHNGLVEIFSGDNAVYSLIITSQKKYFNRIDKNDYEQTVKSYITYISNVDLLNNGFTEFRKVSNHLYRLIFRGNSLPTGRVIISPDGRYFPFESLVINNDSKKPVYFLSCYATSYAYSARYMMTDFGSATNAPSGNFMGVAPLYYRSNTGLSSLDGSNASLEKIDNYISGTYNLEKSDATKGNFQRKFAGYKIIQLYTHGSDSSERKEPVIYFADSALYLSELIPERKPVTQLIVLSACETGNGINYQGEGVFSFNRGFAALGIPSSVTNLWYIDNVSTYKLTELFYKYLSQNLPLDIALQKAKLEYSNHSEGENRLPYYWAAPILVGKTDPIILDKPFAWKYLFAGIGFAALIFFGWKKLSKSIA